MEEIDVDKEFEKFIAKHNISYNPATKKWSKPFHNVLGIRWVKSEKGAYNDKKGEKGYWENYFVKWKLGNDTHRLPQCSYCFTELSGKQKRYCSDNCRILAKQVKDKRQELGAELIIHSEKKINGKRMFPQWKDFKVTYYDGRTGTLTNKKGKQREIIKSDYKRLN